ncbi:hypothetical protein WDL1CHR_06093 [Variovorax sp. WDL1]|nr:hypothetical protein [Variovorax sp. WDL1]KWT74126.1 hypothetical protein APY03_5680 [Variovorax sp. WDL1]PNG52183.1 hypothetical protein CHC07_04554 [Variovorax sp. B4]PNG54723.1 hypothetical protein CHC06_03520 [Variovorax sp. B2]VTV15716.1 hypothetical protein WDL1CHR_06093 [Variovorax sp. WDL1]
MFPFIAGSTDLYLFDATIVAFDSSERPAMASSSMPRRSARRSALQETR